MRIQRPAGNYHVIECVHLAGRRDADLLPHPSCRECIVASSSKLFAQCAWINYFIQFLYNIQCWRIVRKVLEIKMYGKQKLGIELLVGLNYAVNNCQTQMEEV